MTEDEAKTTRCCGPEGCGAPVKVHPDYGTVWRLCIGSECMAWRWDDPQSIDVAISSVDRGHCGLAGKP